MAGMAGSCIRPGLGAGPRVFLSRAFFSWGSRKAWDEVSMLRVIKPEEGRQVEVVAFERSVLETIGVGSKESVDPAVILAEARAEAELKVREAFAEGTRRGIEAGKTQFKESVGESAETLRKVGEVLQEERQAFLDSLEPQVVELAFSIARRILRREAQVSPEVVQTTVRAALEQVLDQEHVVIHVNPGDLEVIRGHRVTLLDDFDGIHRLDVVPDEAVESGGCVAESGQLHVDARLDAQLEQILDTLME